MQIEVIEFARNAAGLEMANSTEFEQDTPHPVIDIMPDQVGVDMGGTMRLGRWPCQIVPGTLAEEVYSSDLVHERHRHRYEVNKDRKSTRLNSSHANISYAVFCLKKKKITHTYTR